MRYETACGLSDAKSESDVLSTSFKGYLVVTGNYLKGSRAMSQVRKWGANRSPQPDFGAESATCGAVSSAVYLLAGIFLLIFLFI